MLAPSSKCWVCNLIEQHAYELWEDQYCKVVLSEFPRFWGHILVVLKEHQTAYSELSQAQWGSLSANSWKAARLLEDKLNPVRCYIAGLGTERSDLVMSSPHLHFNIIPIPEKDLKPSEILTWENGIYSGSELEWEQLKSELLT